jgi:hypothetical protein
MLKFYGWLLPVLIGLANIALLVDKEYFIKKPILSFSIAIVILIIPALIFLFFRSSRGIIRVFRIFSFRILRVRVFVLFGILFLSISLFGILLGLLDVIQIQSILLGSFIIVNVVLFYFLLLVLNGNFKVHEPTDFLFRHKNKDEVYLYVNGAGRHIPDPQTLFLLGWSFDDVVILDEKEFNAFRIDRPLESVSNARIVRPDDNKNEAWMILGDERRLINPLSLSSIQSLNPTREIENIPRSQLASWREDKPLAAIVFQSEMFNQANSADAKNRASD